MNHPPMGRQLSWSAVIYAFEHLMVIWEYADQIFDDDFQYSAVSDWTSIAFRYSLLIAVTQILYPVFSEEALSLDF